MKFLNKIKPYFIFFFLVVQSHSYAADYTINKIKPDQVLSSEIVSALIDSRKDNSNADPKESLQKFKSYISQNKSLLLQKDYPKGTLLHLAAFYNCLEAAKYIISQAPELVNVTNDITKYDGQTPLHLAVRSMGMGSKKKLIKLLIDNGANIKAVDAYGRQPIHYACSSLDQIMKAGADDINVQDSIGNTILHLQTQNWNTKGISASCVQGILKRGINASIKNVHGDTALDLLKKYKLSHKHEYLEREKEKVRKLLIKRKWKDFFNNLF